MTDIPRAIRELREQIDRLDLQVVELLNERAGCALSIGGIKAGNDLPIYEPDREEEILNRVVAASRGPLPEEAVRRLFERILDESRGLERASVSGPEGPCGGDAGQRR